MKKLGDISVTITAAEYEQLLQARNDLQKVTAERDGLINAVRELEYYMTTTHLDMGGNHKYHLRGPKGFRAWERLRAQLEGKEETDE